MSKKQRVIVGLSGASGVIYGIRTLLHLRAMEDVEVHLVMSEGARVNIRIETDYDVDAVREMADVVHRPDHLAASISSGSFRTAGMIVIPCSVKSLSGIVNSYGDNLLARAADVCLKERRKLVVVPRETPLSLIHLRNMVSLTEAGGVVLPAMPGFYHQPSGIADLVDFVVQRICDQLGIDVNISERWGD